jgi:GNAT superfamily N-acetyltransferase
LHREDIDTMESTDPAIRPLTAGDLDEAFGLSSTAGWNQRIADWRMLLQLAPAGGFAAVAGGRIVGTAIGIDYGTFGWIAMMLVDPGWRGRGVGSQLLEEAMGAVPPGLPIRLDATPLGQPLYRRYGFEDEAELTRHVAEPSRPLVDPAPAVEPRRVRRLKRADLPRLIAQDDRVFGAHRRILLEWALAGAEQYAHLIETDAGANYCFGRPGRLFDQIGPVVAADDERARALVSAALRAADAKAVVVDAYDRHAGFTVWLESRGFVAARPLFRMCRAGDRGAWARSGKEHRAFAERAIFGPEFG